MLRATFAVFIGAALVGVGTATAACPDIQPKPAHSKKNAPRNPCVNLSIVPQISAQVAGAAPMPARKSPTFALPEEGPYQGPTLGMTKPDPGVRPVPTVGYHWSLQ